ncbi:hypothetical protein ACXDF8_02385 [Mycolicibacterium sp. CBM1]
MEPTPADAGPHTVAPGHHAGAATHTRHPAPHTGRLVAAAAGALAVVAAIGVGTTALLRSPEPAASTLTSASLITVTPTFPVSGRELAALVARSPDFGPLADPRRRASCLSGLGYPGSIQVLGAEQVQIDGRAAVVLVLPGDRPDELVGVAVAPNCSAVDTAKIADTAVRRP